MVEFGGWSMPVQYTGILEEHRAVREAAGLFDVSHMGEIRLQGPDALGLVQRLITNDASGMSAGQVIYSPMCLETGGVVDDLLVYRMGSDDYLLVVNASNTEKDLAWVRRHAAGNVTVTDQSPETAQLALQGPRAVSILQPLADVDLGKIKYYWFDRGRVGGIECVISRTGYTGEDGFELYLPPEKAEELWNGLLAAGKEAGLAPVGLGARDTLRFEACMPLYGHELTEQSTPLEAGLGRFVSLDKPDFTGKEALARQQAEGLKRKLVGLEMIDRGVPRAGYPVVLDGTTIGQVTSGSFSPTLNKNLAMAFVETPYAAAGREVGVTIREKVYRARVVPRPFYKKQ
ncbi:glycine cleavage system protein T [Clostridiales bacterium PH28_bin88]|nr:glycine cleavage system protein T [Clostridiales bacterium PH28_bin88]